MAQDVARATNAWQDYWWITPRYERWIESLGVPIHRSYYVEDLREIEVGPWEEREINAAVVVLEGNKDFMETRVTELPPGATVPPVKFSLDDIIYVLSGQGLCTVWAGDGPRKTFEWQPHSLFLIPRNYTYQLSNMQGHQAARLFHYNYLPMAMSITPDPEYFFNNPALQPTSDISAGEEHDVYSFAKWVQGARGSRRGGWVASFFPDLTAFDKVHSHEGYGGAMPNLDYCLPNVTSLKIGGRVLPSGTYKPAHYHGSGAVVLIPEGQGFSLMWPAAEGGEKMIVPWREGSIFGPPNMWYHQHFNTGPNPMRYITLHPARHIEPAYGGSQIPYWQEEAWVRQTFEAELAKQGVKSQMPPDIYTNPKFTWEAPGED